MANPETVLQSKIMVAISQLGAVPCRMQVGQFYTRNAVPIYIGIPGTPDVLIIAPDGITLWYEIKTDTGILSDEQIQFHAMLTKLKHHVYTIRSVEQATKIYKEVLQIQ